MEIELSQPGSLARVGFVSQDRMRIWLELKDGRTATVDSRGDPFELQVGAVLMVRQGDSHLELAPRDLWPASAAAEPTDTGVWVGVVRLRVEDVTVIDIGGRWLRVPTNPEVAYERGNTVEGTTVVGVTRVLDRDPIRILELPTLTDDVIEAFLLTPKEPLTFDDFGGLPGIVRRAQELIELPLQRADKLRKIGAPPIKGVLFTGPPGTGKTLLARIIASSAGATFYAISGPTVFSKWYGESEELLRRIFEHAAARAPSIIFFDEIDSVAGQRNEEAHEASKRVVAQLLTLMDGLSSEKNVTVIAATNRPQDIDVALTYFSE
jgi:transitional endoplasmic reticulum ATPase